MHTDSYKRTQTVVCGFCGWHGLGVEAMQNHACNIRGGDIAQACIGDLLHYAKAEALHLSKICTSAKERKKYFSAAMQIQLISNQLED